MTSPLVPIAEQSKTTTPLAPGQTIQFFDPATGGVRVITDPSELPAGAQNPAIFAGSQKVGAYTPSGATTPQPIPVANPTVNAFTGQQTLYGTPVGDPRRQTLPVAPAPTQPPVDPSARLPIEPSPEQPPTTTVDPRRTRLPVQPSPDPTLPSTDIVNQTFGPDNNLIGTFFDPSPSETLQDYLNRTQQAADALGDWQMPDYTAVSNEEYSDYTNRANQALEQALQSIGNMSIPEFQQLELADPAQAQGLLEEAANLIRGRPDIPEFQNIPMSDTGKTQAIIDAALGRLNQSNINEYAALPEVDFSTARNYLNQAAGYVQGINVGTVPQVGPIDYGQANQDLASARNAAAGATLQRVGDVAPIDYGQTQGQIGAAQQALQGASYNPVAAIDQPSTAAALGMINQGAGIAGNVGLENFAPIAGPNLTLANQAIASAMGSAGQIPNAIQEYENIALTDPAEAERLLRKAVNQASQAQMGGFGVVGTPSGSYASAQTQQGVLQVLEGQRAQEQALGNLEGIETSDIAAGTYDPSQAQDLARQLSVQGLAGVFDTPDRAQNALDLYNYLLAQTADQRQLGVQQIGQGAAAMGRLSSGMVTTSLGDLESQLQRIQDQEASRLAAEQAGFQMSDRTAQLQAALAASGQFTEQDLANAQMQLGLRNEARTEEERQLQSAIDQAMATGQLGLNQGVLGVQQGELGMQDFQRNLMTQQFSQAERDARQLNMLRNAQLKLQGAGIIAGASGQQFAMDTTAFNQQLANQQQQLAQDQALAQAYAQASGAYSNAAQPAIASAGLEYDARAAERAFQATRDLQQQQLALQQAGVLGTLGTQNWSVNQGSGQLQLAEQSNMMQQAMNQVNAALGQAQGYTSLGGLTANMAQAQTGVQQGNQAAQIQQAMNAVNASLGQAGAYTDIGRLSSSNAQAQSQIQLQNAANQIQQQYNAANIALGQADAMRMAGATEADIAQMGYSNAANERNFQLEQDRIAAQAAASQASGATALAGQQYALDTLGFGQQMQNAEMAQRNAAARSTDVLNAAGQMGNLGVQTGQVDANYYNMQAAERDAAMRNAMAQADLSGQQSSLLQNQAGITFDIGEQLRQSARYEGDRAANYGLQELDALSQILGSYGNVTQQQAQLEALQRDELARERGYQYNLEQDAIDRAIQQQIVQDQLLSSDYQRYMQYLDFLAQYGLGGSSAAELAAAQSYINQAGTGWQTAVNVGTNTGINDAGRRTGA